MKKVKELEVGKKKEREEGKGRSIHHVVQSYSNEQGLPEYLITSDGSVSF